MCTYPLGCLENYDSNLVDFSSTRVRRSECGTCPDLFTIFGSTGGSGGSGSSRPSGQITIITHTNETLCIAT